MRAPPRRAAPPRVVALPANPRRAAPSSSLTLRTPLPLPPEPLPFAEQLHLQHLYQRCQSAEELEKALRLTRLNYLARGELHQHNPFSHRTSLVLLHEAMRLGVPEVARHALTRAAEFGLPPGPIRQFNQLLIYYSKHAQLPELLETYELMKRAGPRPDSETCFILVKGCVDNARRDLAELVVAEFEAGGVRVRNGTRLYLQRGDGEAGGAESRAEA
jgi:hypothetical protein